MIEMQFCRRAMCIVIDRRLFVYNSSTFNTQKKKNEEQGRERRDIQTFYSTLTAITHPRNALVCVLYIYWGGSPLIHAARTNINDEDTFLYE